MSAKRALERMRAPDEHAAEERAWTVVRAAHLSRQTVSRPRTARRYVVGCAIALVLGAIGLSPAGATVGRLLTRALGIQHAASAISSLPTPGELLVSGPGGTWSVAADGSLTRLGPWPVASWSPHGRYVAVVSGGRLSAIDRHGITQWTLVRPGVSDPRWFPPSGYRVAYLSAGRLRVVAGDGTGDHLVAAGVASVAPAWRPGHAYQLAYVTLRGTLVVRDGDSGALLWSGPAEGATRLQWSADGRFLATISARGARVYGAGGALVSAIPTPAGGFVTDGALSPNGQLIALVLGGGSQQVLLARVGAAGATARRFTLGPGLGQVMWSPNSRWLLVAWPAADQWVFRRVTGTPLIAAVSHITRQFSSGTHEGFPRLDGWCCTAG